MSTDFASTKTTLDVSINGSRDAVWRALTSQINDWWPGSFNVGGDRATFAMEARPGGRMFEDHGDGEGYLWATVVQVQARGLLCVAGDIFPGWGGPCRWLGTFKLEDGDAGTTLSFEDCRFGVANDKRDASLEEGWRYLLAGCLKAYVEGRPLPEWEG